MTFAYLVHDWLIRGVFNQSQTRFIKDIINSEKCYIIYLLRIIDIQKELAKDYHPMELFRIRNALF